MSAPQPTSARGASFLILIQVVSRSLTFLVNQLLLRYISPELLGAAAQYELYCISVLYFARESLQVALLRQVNSSQAAVNVSYFALLLGLPLSYILASVYKAWSLPDVGYASDSLWWYCLASMLELCCEPSFTVVQQALAYKVRAAAQTAATIARCLVTFSCYYWASRNDWNAGVLPFAYGQLAYAGVLLVVYISQTIPLAAKRGASLLPRKLKPNPNDKFYLSYMSRNSCLLALNMYFQTAIKYVLTQGDSFIVASIMSLGDQGTYALASNYGALIARMLFQPIEESSRGLYARLCATAGKSSKQQKEDTVQARLSIYDILKAYNLLALLAWSLGPALAPTFFEILTGSRWAQSGAGVILGEYCYYIPLLALNGVSEAFVAAVATSSELRTQSYIMAGYSIGFACAAYVFLGVLKLGATGLIWANCVNMALRIIWNVRFISSFFERRQLTFEFYMTLPSSLSVAAAVGAATILRADVKLARFTELTSRFILGAGASVYLVLSLLYLERAYFTRLLLPLVQRSAR